MIQYYKTIDNGILNEIHRHEDALLNDFKEEFLNTYSGTLLKHNLHSEIRMERWIDTKTRKSNIENDGYSAMIQVDLFDENNAIPEIDEFVCSCFVDITHIAYFRVLRRYRVFQADDENLHLRKFWGEIGQMIHMVNQRTAYAPATQED